MNVTIEEQIRSDQERTLVVSGEVDAFTAPQLREKLMPLCQENCKVYLNLSQVDYMDSTGLGVLIGAFKKLRSQRGRLILTGVSPRLKRLLNITGLSEILEIEDRV
ncbi:STAS domain-containing protein [Melghirimyces algeriensis]|uniref:Anti-sigma factor antagonist n=1 Tax=Melghirimyces algeriensis TaxID=910412 RepID=A0A521EZ36_9BACL|nr:STAS domain-containing protein [Melghirimyces algeriensis]SMO89096.1 anti-sigma B factor antagonist [Melghirimyces algeriensis]